jgi:hypothetical protein
MTNHKNPADSLEHFFTALAESEFSTEDEQAVADQEDSDRAERLRTLMLDSIKRVKLERRARAEQAHRTSVEQLQQSKAMLPPTAEQRRQLLDRTLRNRPDVREMTLQHREFRELSDDDVERLLTKMHHLGALTDGNGDDDGGAST